jgi:hypothetical protein
VIRKFEGLTHKASQIWIERARVRQIEAAEDAAVELFEFERPAIYRGGSIEQRVARLSTFLFSLLLTLSPIEPADEAKAKFSIVEWELGRPVLPALLEGASLEACEDWAIRYKGYLLPQES